MSTTCLRRAKRCPLFVRLVVSSTDPNTRKLEGTTTQRADYSERNAELGRKKQPTQGVRTAVAMKQVIGDATTELEMSRTKSGDEPWSTTYRQTLSDTMGATQRSPPRPPKPSVNADGLPEYVAEKPITVYTANPKSGARMKVPGVTAESSVAPAHGRNTQFSNSKYACGGC